MAEPSESADIPATEPEAGEAAESPPSASAEATEENGSPAAAAAGTAGRSAEQIEQELSDLKSAMEGKEGSEIEELEEKIQALEKDLTAATTQASTMSKPSVMANAGNGDGEEHAVNADGAEKDDEDTDSKPADADTDQPTSDATEAGDTKKEDDHDDSAEKEVDIEMATSAAVRDDSSKTRGTESRSSAAGGRKSSRSVSRAASRLSQQSSGSTSKPPTRSGKSRRLSRRQSESPDVLGDIPRLRKRGEAPPSSIQPLSEVSEQGSQVGISADPLERLVGPIFRRADVNNDKVLSLEEILRMFRSPELGLHLSKADLLVIQKALGLTDDSELTYHQFIPLAQQVLMRVYQLQDPDSMDEWIELVTAEGDAIWFNRFSGQGSFGIPEGYSAASGGESNLIEDVIREIFEKANIEKTGVLSQDEFINLLQSNELGLYLSEEEIIQIAGRFDNDQDGKITFEEFVPLAKSLIMNLYQKRDPSANEWCQLNSRQAGLFWFNKRTGETRRQLPAEVTMQQHAEDQERQQEVMFVQQALSDLEGVQYELEAERQQRGEVEYQLAAVAEEAEAARIHLDETGQQLDDANEKLTEHVTTIKDKDQTIEQCRTHIKELEDEVAALVLVKAELAETQQALQDSRAESDERAGVISDQESVIAGLREQISKLTVELRGQTSIVQDQAMIIEELAEKLAAEEAKNRHLENEMLQVPVMEGELQKTETLLMQTQKHLDEKASALTVTRKSLRNVKDKNSELEEGLNIVSELRDKLHAARCEVHTLRQFVGGKTALVLQRERELDMAKQRMKEMEEKDSRRAQVLASVLEKTARMQQDTRSKTLTDGHFQPESGGAEMSAADRPLSCPALLPIPGEYEDDEDYVEGYGEHRAPGTRRGVGAVGNSFAARPVMTRGAQSTARSPTKLPPVSRVSRRPETRAPTKAFQPITPAYVKAGQRSNDATFSGPLFPANLEPGRTLKSIPISYALPEDDEAAADAVAAQQVKIGDRVLVRRKRMPWEPENTKSSGIVRYVGRVDSEFVDNRVYVGVQLDNADGDHDGVVKGKRYFRCAPKRGLLVRITDVVSVLPQKSLVYRPLMSTEMPSAISA